MGTSIRLLELGCGVSLLLTFSENHATVELRLFIKSGNDLANQGHPSESVGEKRITVDKMCNTSRF